MTHCETYDQPSALNSPVALMAALASATTEPIESKLQRTDQTVDVQIEPRSSQYEEDATHLPQRADLVWCLQILERDMEVGLML